MAAGAGFVPVMVLSSIPSPPGNAVSVGPFEVRAYGLAIAAGVVVAIALARRRWARRGGDPDDVTSIALWAVLAGLAGARVYHVITDWHRFEGRWWHAFAVWEGGLGIPGGLPHRSGGPGRQGGRGGARPMRALALVVLVALLAGGVSHESEVDAAAAPDSGSAGAATDDYPDAITRRFHRMATEPRPVEPSAIPPRHLDSETFPDSLVPRDQIVWGGVAPDAIPALDDPAFAPASTVDWLEDQEAVLALTVGGETRAYPVQLLMWHEIVNDEIGGRPVAVTYCPLCNSGVALDRRIDGRTLDFGTSGSLYLSALVMYDRQTESLWTHFDGRAVLGTLAGTELDVLPMATVAWEDFRRAHPDADVLSRDTGYDRPYGRNAYRGYDQGDGPLPGFFPGSVDVDPRQAGMARVVGFGEGPDAVAVLTDHLADVGVVHLELGGRPVVVWHLPGTASALHRDDVADGDDVGATGVFLTGGARFAREGSNLVDEATGSTWNVLGEAVDGARQGDRLEPVPHLDTFWFAWSSYRPDTALVD